MKTKIIIAWILLFFVLQGCSSRKSSSVKKPETSESTYEIEKYNTWDGQGKILNIQLFDFKDKTQRYPFRFALVNGIAVKDSIVRVASETKSIDLQISQYLKHPVNISELQITKGDSLVVRAYLKDTNTIFD